MGVHIDRPYANKKTIAKDVAGRVGISNVKSEEYINTLIDVCNEHLENGEDVKLYPFVNFKFYNSQKADGSIYSYPKAYISTLAKKFARVTRQFFIIRFGQRKAHHIYGVPF